MKQKIGVIGGSGLYELDGMTDVSSGVVETPFGSPSDSYVRGTFNGCELYFLARHGPGHGLLPSEINHRANIYGFKKLGVEHIISLSAVGSLREEMAPRDMVMVDQFFDRTKHGEEHSFFGEGIVAHIAFGEPICQALRETVYEVAREHLAGCPAGVLGRPPQAYGSGTYINMEGPAFSTKAESRLYRQWGLDVIGMTNLAEAKLAREAEICYCTIAMVTDYDCWHETHDEVSVDMLLATLSDNVAAGQAILGQAIPKIAELGPCSCRNAMQNSILTSPEAFPAKTREKLALLLAKHYPG